jgi:hypothetical protein
MGGGRDEKNGKDGRGNSDPDLKFQRSACVAAMVGDYGKKRNFGFRISDLKVGAGKGDGRGDKDR